MAREPMAGNISVLTEMNGPGDVRQLVTRRNPQSATCVPQTQRHGEVRAGEKKNRTKRKSKAKAKISGRRISRMNNANPVMVICSGVEFWLA
jgi:hypothetical protein